MFNNIAFLVLLNYGIFQVLNDKQTESARESAAKVDTSDLGLPQWSTIVTKRFCVVKTYDGRTVWVSNCILQHNYAVSLSLLMITCATKFHTHTEHPLYGFVKI